jgi:hypothetical protein
MPPTDPRVQNERLHDLYIQLTTGRGTPYAEVYSSTDSVLNLDWLRQAVTAPKSALHPGSDTVRPILRLWGRCRELATTMVYRHFQTPVEREAWETQHYRNRPGNVNRAFFKGVARAR